MTDDGVRRRCDASRSRRGNIATPCYACIALQVFEIRLDKSEAGTSSAVTKARTRPDTIVVANSCTVRGVGGLQVLTACLWQCVLALSPTALLIPLVHSC